MRTLANGCPWRQRRWMQLWLELMWLLDAALQFQPFMFGPSFVRMIIERATAGNPAVSPFRSPG